MSSDSPKGITQDQYKVLMGMKQSVKSLLSVEMAFAIEMAGYDRWLESLSLVQASMYIIDAQEYILASRAQQDRMKREAKALESRSCCPACKKKFSSKRSEVKKQCPRCKHVFFEVPR